MLIKNNYLTFEIQFFPNFSQRLFVLFFLIFILAFSIPTRVFSEEISKKMWGGLSQNDQKIIRDVAILIDNKKFANALNRAIDLKTTNYTFYQALQNIVLWNKYSKQIESNDFSFNDISRFIMDNSYFPNIVILQDNAEKLVVRNRLPKSSYEIYFEHNKPRNKSTKIYLLEEKISALSNSTNYAQQDAKIKEIQALVSDIWINSDFSNDEELDFLRKYGNRLSEVDHVARADQLLWKGKFNSLNNVILLVNDDYKKLFEAIAKIGENPQYINNIVLSVPRKLRDNEQLLYRRAVFYNNTKENDDLTDLLLKIESAKRPLDWWRFRSLQGRELLKKKEYKDAYRIISNHNLNSKSIEYTEAEWLSGWIALRFLDDPKIAIKHFQNMYNNVSYPISVSKAAYWIAMCYQKMDDKVNATNWYKIAAQYPTYFYGQVAISKYHRLNNLALDNFPLPKIPDIYRSDINSISKNTSLKVAYLLALMNDKADALKVFTNIIDKLNSKAEVAIVVRLVEEIGDDSLTYKIYRFANRKDVFFIDKQYKIIKELREEKNAALLHSLIKQESNFSPSAMSVVGAIGLMQVMPETAKIVAKKLDLEYSYDRLKNDIRYNIKIGSYYINNLLENFNESKILAIASYNAGPARTKKWIEEFYDPRDYPITDNYEKNLDKIVDWTELITYAETRNYVQRVGENILVYDYLLNKNNPTKSDVLNSSNRNQNNITN